MPQCQLRIFCCFSFQKSYTGNILGIGRNEKPDSYFPGTYTESKGEKEGSHEASTPPGGAAPPLAVPRRDVGPTGAFDQRTWPIYSPRHKNPKTIDHLPRKVPSRRRHRNLVLGDRCSVLAPCRDGESAPGPSPSTPSPSPSLLLPPMMRRE